MSRYYFLFVVIAGLVLVFSCSKGDSIQPDVTQQERTVQDFADPTVIFPDAGDDRIFYDADVCEILQGPGLHEDEGELWDQDGNHWAVAVALGEDSLDPTNENRDICYRFLGDEGDMSVMSPVMTLTSNNRDRFVRVAACYFEYPLPEEDPPLPPEDIIHYTFVEVTFVCQRWNPTSERWNIHVIRLGFDPADFNDIENITPVWSVATFTIDEGKTGLGVMMPDVAYDPRDDQSGALHLVFTRYDTAIDAYVYSLKGRRHILLGHASNVHWDANSTICQLNYHNGFHPRIDVGEISFGGAGWKVGVSFTGVTYVGDDDFTTCLTFGSADNWPTGFADVPVWSPGNAGGMPTIDIGTPDADSGAIAWTQSREQPWNDVTVIVGYYHGGYANVQIFDPEPGLYASASPSVAVWNGLDEDVYNTSVSYLMTPNPNSWSWNPCARLVWTDSEGSYLSDEQLVTDITHGEFDTGSQYSNWYGMSTALSADDNGNYWMLWSGWESNEEIFDDGLKRVYGTYGFAEQ